MAFVPTPNGLKWAINFALGTRPVALTGHAYTPDPTQLAQRQQLSANLASWLAAPAGLMHIQSYQLNAQTIVVTDISSASGGVWIDILPQPNFGADNTESVPAQTAMVITEQTVSRGRSFRGRFYVPGVPDHNRVDPSNWASAAVAAWQGVFNNLLVELNQGGQYLAVCSLRINKAPRPNGVLTQVVTVRANARIGSQRRRTGGF